MHEDQQHEDQRDEHEHEHEHEHVGQHEHEHLEHPEHVGRWPALEPQRLADALALTAHLTPARALDWQPGPAGPRGATR